MALNDSVLPTAKNGGHYRRQGRLLAGDGIPSLGTLLRRIQAAGVLLDTRDHATKRFHRPATWARASALVAGLARTTLTAGGAGQGRPFHLPRPLPSG